MADSIREKIMANIKTALAAITTVNGYVNNITNVQRWKQNGNSIATVPAIIINGGPEDNKDDRFPLTTCMMTIFVDLYIREAESSTSDTDTVLNSLLQDIKKAVKVDITRGGNAVDTTFKSIVPFETIEGQAFAGLIIEVEVEYRHQQTDPTVAG